MDYKQIERLPDYAKPHLENTMSEREILKLEIFGNVQRSMQAMRRDSESKQYLYVIKNE